MDKKALQARFKRMRLDHIVKANGYYKVMLNKKVLRSFRSEEEAIRYQNKLDKLNLENPGLANAVAVSSKGGKLKRPKLKELPVAHERRFNKSIDAYFELVKKTIGEQLINRLPELSNEMDRGTGTRVDSDFTEKLQEIFVSTRESVANTFDISGIFESIGNAGNAMKDFSRDNFNRGAKKAIGIDLATDDTGLGDMIDLFSVANASEIENVSTDLMAEVEASVRNGLAKGLRPEEIANQIMAKDKDFEGFKGRFTKAKNRMKFIARNELERLNANLNEARQRKAGLDKFVWRTAKDNRVRETHKLEGQIFYWTKDKSEDGKSKPHGNLNPGMDYNCRCFAEPYLDDFLNS